MTTPNALEDRVSKLETFVHHDLAVKVESMNWAIGQTYQGMKSMRVDIAGVQVSLAHLEATEAGLDQRLEQLEEFVGQRLDGLGTQLGDVLEIMRAGNGGSTPGKK